jgi:hypothetical protein
MKNAVIPLHKRKQDIIILAFYIFNLVFITYFFDLEQVVIPNASHFTYPVWPPKFLVDLAHWYGRTFDPLMLARPVWWKMTIWIDVLLFGPYYIAAIYAFIRGREWIRILSIIASTMLLTNVIIILGEEVFGSYPAINLPMVILANLSWIIFPIFVIIRMAFNDHPFTLKKGGKS